MATFDPPLPPPGCLVLGVGCDYIEIDRVRGVLERHGERFIRRVFTDEERAYCDAMKYPFRHYAARFAAKEAVSKTFTTGICEHFGWHSASIHHGPRHEPLVRLDDKGEALLRRFGATGVWVSLSHSDTAAMAFALLVRNPRTAAAP
jgi:holo-[acyl-carrier protein] synthase